MNTKNLEKLEEWREFLYHVKELLEVQDRLRALVEKLDSSYKRDQEASQTVMGQLETELYFHLPYHIRELREPFERVLKELYGEDAKILVDQDDEMTVD